LGTSSAITDADGFAYQSLTGKNSTKKQGCTIMGQGTMTRK